MLDALLKLVDYGVRLLETRGKYDERILDRIVTPTVQLGEQVLQDYLRLFAELKQRADADATVAELIRFLEEGRLTYLPVRIRLRALLAQKDLWRHPTDRRLVAGLFGMLCGGLNPYEETQLGYREGIRLHHERGFGHTLLDILYRIDQRPRDHRGPQLAKLVHDVVTAQEEVIKRAWMEVAEAYASLQASVATTGTLRKRPAADGQPTP